MTMLLWLAATLGCQKATPPTNAASTSAPEPPQATTTASYALPVDAAALLTDPGAETVRAPEEYWAELATSEGDIVLHVVRVWSPHAADRFYNLVRAGFYDQSAFFRTIDGFVAQFGLSAIPEVNAAWRDATMPDDPVILSNTRGRASFAMRGVPNSRTTQLFINLSDNQNLDGMGFAPFGEVVAGFEVLDALHRTGEGAPRGSGPDQMELVAQGNALIDARYPEIDRVLTASILEGPPAADEGEAP